MTTKPSLLGRDNRSYSDSEDTKQQEEDDQQSESDQQLPSTDLLKSQLTPTNTTTSDSQSHAVSLTSNSSIVFIHDDND